MPVYNAAEYLPAALNSLLNQEVPMEIIVINDGSTDSSRKICLDYAKKHKEILVLSQANAGPSAARNAALQICQGDYINFMDADDELAPGTLQQNCDWLQEHPAIDALCFPVTKVLADASQQNLVEYKQEQVLSREQAFSLWCTNSKLLTGYVWGKIYRRSVWKNLHFPEHLRLAEDMFVLSDVLARCNQLFFSPRGSYRYYERDGAATRSGWTVPKAKGLLQAYIHRWQTACVNDFALNTQIQAWSHCIALLSGEKKNFPNESFSEARRLLEKHDYSWWQMFRACPTLRSFAGLIWNLIQLRKNK